MPDAVECAECGHRYDSEETPFCPRCGSTRHGTSVQSAVVSASRRTAGVRRLQAGGIVMVCIASLLLVAVLFMLVVPDPFPPSVREGFADYPGGAVTVYVHNGTAPVANATLQWQDLDGAVVATNQTDAMGWWNGTAPRGFAVLAVVDGNDTWMREVLAAEGLTRHVSFDVSRDPGSLPPVIFSDDELLTLRITAGVFTGLLALTLVGGIAAIRRRGRAWAMAGLATSVLPALLALFVDPVVGLLVAGPFILAAVLVLPARHHFLK